MTRRSLLLLGLLCAAFAATLAAAATAAAAPPQETRTASATVTTTLAPGLEIVSQRGTATTTAALHATVEIAPFNRSVCVRPKAAGQPGVVTLQLEGMRWSGWNSLCERLTRFLRADKLPYTEAMARGSERLLSSTGYFAAVRCTITSTGAGLDCAMSPEPIIRDITVEGHLPFVLLKDDIRRQLFLRSGKILPESPEPLDEQANRIEHFLERQGFFGSSAAVRPHELPDGAEPNRAIRLEARVKVGDSGELRDIHIIGNPDATDEEVATMFEHYWVFAIFPRRFTPERFDEDIEAFTNLLKRRGYPEAHVEGRYKFDAKARSVDIKLRVHSGPLLLLHFRGNHALGDDALADVATFTNAGSADMFEVENTRKRIIARYQRAGYFDVGVEARVSDAGAPPPPPPALSAFASTGARSATAAISAPRTARGQQIREVTYVIQEGPWGEVAKVEITGNRALETNKIISGAQVKTRASRLFSPGRWVDEVIERDREAIVEYYRQQGFPGTDVTVDRSVIGTGKLGVTFKVDEGPRQQVLSLIIEGAPASLSQEDMRKHLQLVDGAPFVPSRLASDRRTLLTMLAAQGYPRATVSRKMRAPPEDKGGLVTLDYQIDPGPLSVLGGLFVRGNFRTDEGVVREELSLSDGDPLDLVKVEEAKHQLRRLGVFASVQLEPLDTWKTSRETWLLAEVQELDRRSMDVAFGFRTDEYFSLGADATDNNLFGRAIRLDLGARLSNADQVLTNYRIGLADRLTGKMTAPHPLGLPFTIQFSGEYVYEDKPIFKLRGIGATITASRPIIQKKTCDECPNLIGSLVYKLSSNNLTVPIQDISSGQVPITAQNDLIRVAQLLEVPNQTIGRVGPHLTIERTDSIVDPRSGYSGDISFEFAHPTLAGPLALRAAPFWRFLWTADAFVPIVDLGSRDLSGSTRLGGPLVLATGVRYGTAEPLRSDQNVPLTETFAYGGDLDVRGVVEKASTVAFLGANHVITSTLELRYYFLHTSFGDLQIAGITDQGFASYRLANIFAAPTVSAGGAFRFVTPVGPVSFAYAVPVVKPAAIVSVDPQAMPSRGRLHFSFGYTF